MLHHWAKRLDPARFRVTVLAMGRGGLSDKFEANYPVYYDDTGYPGIAGFIERLKPDIVHCAPGGGMDMPYITKAAALAPTTQTVMCPREVGNYDDVVASVVISRFVLALQSRRENIFQIDPPFDASDYSIRYGKEHFGLPAGRLIIGSLGNSRKENSHFFNIAKRYGRKDVHFVIKSDKRPGSFFGPKNLTSINRLLSEDEKMSLISCLDIFLYPTSNEAYGVVFLEAMSQKVPIITYDDSANKEAIGDGGLLAPLNDIHGMTDLLDKLVADRGLRERLGQQGYELFRERNDPEKIADKYEEFFEFCLKRHYGGARKA